MEFLTRPNFATSTRETPVMLKRTLILATAAALIAGGAIAAGAVQIDGAWSRPAPQGGTGVGYVTLTSRGKPDRLLSASTPVAERIEIHESMVMDGKAMMHPRPGGVTLPADKAVTLAPGGLHMMMIGLKKPLKVGEAVPVTLKFEKAGAIQASFAVRATAP
jgi:copper(I)-binding protein